MWITEQTRRRKWAEKNRTDCMSVYETVENSTNWKRKPQKKTMWKLRNRNKLKSINYSTTRLWFYNFKKKRDCICHSNFCKPIHFQVYRKLPGRISKFESQRTSSKAGTGESHTPKISLKFSTKLKQNDDLPVIAPNEQENLNRYLFVF